MRLDEKRQVIEVLLCANGCGYHGKTTWDVARLLGHADPWASRSNPAWLADVAWRKSRDDYGHEHQPLHGTVCLEAAYRLIESSPTLRREWFGR